VEQLTRHHCITYLKNPAIDGPVAAINGAEIVEGPYPGGDRWVATFRDPGGNVMGVWHAGPR
jgi:predicted enzyme related to lactoylglutathione lyase